MKTTPSEWSLQVPSAAPSTPLPPSDSAAAPDVEATVRELVKLAEVVEAGTLDAGGQTVEVFPRGIYPYCPSQNWL